MAPRILGTFLMSLDTPLGSRCCDSWIVSPSELVRDVPLSWRPGRSRIGADGDECKRAQTGGDHGACGGGYVDVGVGGAAAERQLPLGETDLSPLSGGRRERPEASKRWASLESGDRRGHPRAGARAGS